VYVGNITFWSGLDTIIEGFALARQSIPAIRLTIVGDGLPGYLDQLIRLVEMHGLVDAVEFRGRVANTEIPNILANADLGIAVFRPIDLRAYAFPLKLLEYMAAGLPVIGNRDMETEDVITRYQCGKCVDFTAGDIADAISEILDDPDTFRKMSVNSRNAAMRHDWTLLMEQEYQLLQAGCLELNPGKQSE
jgi:glycosyltransferase involved in cell wall biosynthesis